MNFRLYQERKRTRPFLIFNSWNQLSMNYVITIIQMKKQEYRINLYVPSPGGVDLVQECVSLKKCFREFCDQLKYINGQYEIRIEYDL
jgi:hypothetical protein